MGGLIAKLYRVRLTGQGVGKYLRRRGLSFPELARQFTHPPALVLAVAAVLAWVSGSPTLAVTITPEAGSPLAGPRKT